MSLNKYCSECGTKLQPLAKFCHSCGTGYGAAKVTQAAQEKQATENNRPRIRFRSELEQSGETQNKGTQSYSNDGASDVESFTPPIKLSVKVSSDGGRIDNSDGIESTNGSKAGQSVGARVFTAKDLI